MTKKQGKNSKKLFQKGGPPGPGRGKKKQPKPITFKEIEQRLQDDLKHKDAKIRHNATKLLLALKKASVNMEDDKISILDPRLQRAFGVAMGGILNDPDISEIDEGDTEDEEVSG